MQYIKKAILLALLSFPFLALSQSVPVRFQVNMSYQIDQGNFNANTDFVDVAGTFNNWDGSSHRLTDSDGDKIYEVSVDGFAVGSLIEFKFRINGEWNGKEEFPGGGENRKYTIKAADNDPLYWYNDEVDPNGSPIANFTTADTRIYSDGIIHYNNLSAGQIASYEWTFEGGIPKTSTEKNPVVRYPWRGTFDATLKVKGNGETQEIKLEDYITVADRDFGETEWWNNTVFYEIFVRSFYDSDGDGIGDFNGIIEKLDYLNDGDPNTTDDLGITGIWLMPIHQSPSYHGYDVIDYRSINPDYGTMDDFKRFLAAAHERGIKVIIDYVVNHSSNQHPWFQNAVSSPNASKRDYYNWTTTKPSYDGPWGQEVWHNSATGYYYGVFWSGMPDLNYKNAEVKEEIFNIADFWLEDIGIDGFRLDAVKYVVEDGDQLEDTEATFSFFRDFRAHYKATEPSAFTVGEAWTSTDKVRQYVEDDGIDFCFEFDLAYAIQGSVNSGDATRAVQQLQRAYNVYPHMQYGTFLSNHDQDRIMNTFGGNQQKMKAAASVYLTTPGVPFVYYGEEIGMRGTKPDEFLRRPMQWTDGVSAGFTTGSPWIALDNNFRTFNVQTETSDPSSLLNWYKQLIAIRNQEETLQTGTFRSVPNNTKNVISFTRQQGEESILVLINVANRRTDDVALNVNLSNIFSKTYEAENLMDGSLTMLEVTASDLIENLTLDAYETRIYKLSGTTHTQTIETNDDWKIYPNPSSGVITLEFSKSTVSQDFTISDIAGKVLLSGQLNAENSQATLNLEQLSKGIYFLKLANGKTKKFAIE